MDFEYYLNKSREKFSLGILDEKLKEEGFLWFGENFSDVLKKDFGVLKKLGCNSLELGLMAQNILNLIERKEVERNIYSDFFEITKDNSFRTKFCPFGCEEDKRGYNVFSDSCVYVFKKGDNPAGELGLDAGAYKRTLGRRAFLVISNLTPHLIAEHGFFQGPNNVAYRTNPERLVEFWETIRGKN